MNDSSLLDVLLLEGGDASSRLQAAQVFAAAHPGTVGWLRNGFVLPLVAPPAPFRFHDAGAACACCAGLLPVRLVLARLLREAARERGWSALVVEAGPATHVDRLAALLAAPPFDARLACPRRLCLPAPDSA